MLEVKLPCLDQQNGAPGRAQRYGDLPGRVAFIELPQALMAETHVWHFFLPLGFVNGPRRFKVNTCEWKWGKYCGWK